MTRRLIDERLRCRLTAEVFVDGFPSVRAAQGIATALSKDGCQLAAGGTFTYLQTLATLGLVDATVARVVEPHLDACAILA